MQIIDADGHVNDRALYGRNLKIHAAGESHASVSGFRPYSLSLSRRGRASIENGNRWTEGVDGIYGRYGH